MLKISNIINELKNHSPFTLLGAMSGLLIMLIFKNISNKTAYDIFYVLHPLHVLLSALVTAAMYKNYQCNTSAKRCNVWGLLLIGYIGSVGIATVSDSIIPYLGESLLALPNKGIHIGLIEKWWLVNPLAFVGILIAYFRSKTKFPHALHVLLSTWASLFHIVMSMEGNLSLLSYIVVFVFLFFAVWFPCCLSDIVFPLLFISKNKK